MTVCSFKLVGLNRKKEKKNKNSLLKIEKLIREKVENNSLKSQWKQELGSNLQFLTSYERQEMVLKMTAGLVTCPINITAAPEACCCF